MDAKGCARVLGEWMGVVLILLGVAAFGALVVAAWRWALGA